MTKIIKEIYSYRQMIAGLVRRDLRGRYKGSVLGFLWTFINPLLQLLVYTLVFGTLFQNDMDNFYFFVFSGLIPWIFISTCIASGCSCVLDQGPLVTKTYFPREILPISYVTSQFINMLYCFVIVIAVYFFAAFSSTTGGLHFIFPPVNAHGDPFSFLPLLALPLLFLIFYVMAIGATFFFSAITVYVRDIKHILGIINMLWMFATPIMWNFEDLVLKKHPNFTWLFLYVNPITGLIEGFHNILYLGRWPNFSYLIAPTAWAFLALLVGLLTFSKAKKRFAEEM